MSDTATNNTPYMLSNIMQQHDLSQRDLTKYLNEHGDMYFEYTSLNKLINSRRWLRKYEKAKEWITTHIQTYLRNNQVPEEQISMIWQDGHERELLKNRVAELDRKNKRIARMGKKALSQLNETRQPELEMLTQKARIHFKVSRDPFLNEINSPEDLFLHEQQRLAREQMLNAVQSGIMLALIGESGAGKTQVRKAFYNHLRLHEERTVVIEPQTIDKRDMTPTLILNAIIDELELRNPPADRERRARFIQKELTERVRLGFKFCLVFEEAHDLPDRVLKFLKRIWEWDDGFRKLLAIILVGQPELKDNLAESQIQVREFSRRCHQVYLYPLADSLADYLTHKLSRAGQDIKNIISDDGIQALRKKLKGQSSYGIARHSEVVDYSYPLTVNAWMAACMNLAASMGEPLITPDLINEVKESL